MKRLFVVTSAVVALLLAGWVAPSRAQQQGYYVLDGFGGVHAGGGAPAAFPQPPYFGFDAGEDIVYVPPGSSGNDGILVLDAFGGVYAAGAIAGSSLNPRTPYFGFDIARGIAVRDTGVSGWERRTSSCFSLAAGNSGGGSTACPASKRVTGGGILYYSNATCTTPYSSFATSSQFVTYSGPASDTSWAAGVFNSSGSTIYYQRHAICMNAN